VELVLATIYFRKFIIEFISSLSEKPTF
jgi:hypothetical protein